MKRTVRPTENLDTETEDNHEEETPDDAPETTKDFVQSLLDPRRIYAYLSSLNIHDLWLNTLRRLDIRHPDRANRIEPTAPPPRMYLRRNRYQEYSRQAAEHYNRLPHTISDAVCQKGRIFFSVPVLNRSAYADMSQRSETHGLANVLAPRVPTDSFYFLLTSAGRQAVECQPVITKGGFCTLMVTYPRSGDQDPPVEEESGLSLLHLVLLPFFPNAISVCGSDFTETEPAGFTRPIARATMIRQNNVIFIILDHLLWEPRKVFSEGHRQGSQYAARFQGSWPGGQLEEDAIWVSCQNIHYIHDDVDRFGINLERISRPDVSGNVVGVVATSITNRVTDRVMPRHLPANVAFYFTVQRVTEKPHAVRFERNPKLFFSGDALNSYSHMMNDPELRHLTMRAPYTIRFRNNYHVIRYNLKYRCEENIRMLVSSVPGNDLFHTCMSVWRQDTALRVTLWTQTAGLTLPQGSPVATIFVIHETTGELRSTGDRAAFRLGGRPGREITYVGDLRLPLQNFP